MDIATRLKTAIFLENVYACNLRSPCKVVGYIIMVTYGFLAVVLHVSGIVFLLGHEWTLRRFLYEMKEIEESWMVYRSIFAYFLIKGIKEDNLSYMFPLVIDAMVELAACSCFLMLQPFTGNGMMKKTMVGLVCSVFVDLLILMLPGNYYRRMTRGNLQSETAEDT